jgi:hypothetical protein
MGNAGLTRGRPAIAAFRLRFMITRQRRFASHRPILDSDGQRGAKPAWSSQETCSADAKSTAISEFLAAHQIDVEKVRRRCPAVLRYDVTRPQAMLQFLSASNVDPAKILNSQPQILQLKPDALASNLAFLQTLPINAKKAVEAYPPLLYLRIHTIQSKMDALARIGLPPERILNRYPEVFGRDIDRALPHIIHFLTKDMGRSLEEINQNSVYLTYSLEKRIKPRHRYMMAHGRRKDFALGTLLNCNDERFAWMVARQPLQHYRDWLASV